MKEKDLSIEFLKFIAVIIVINSHMDMLYGKYSIIATGGAIGDALFFFISGYTIFLGRFGHLFNWYKRRIRRIYPSVIAWAIILSIWGIEQQTPIYILLGGGNWFVSCIMIYYFLLYFVRKYASKAPQIPFVIYTIVVLFWYFNEDKGSLFMYGETYFKWVHYFFFMLTGAYIGHLKLSLTKSPKFEMFLLIISLIFFYVIQFAAKTNHLISSLQILSLIALMGIVYYSYKLCSCQLIKYLMKSKIGIPIRFISCLCLDAYIVQSFIICLFAKNISNYYPFSIILAFISILVVAYINRCLGNIILQLFANEDLSWKKAINPLI